jgi:hypothetical protein
MLQSVFLESKRLAESKYAAKQRLLQQVLTDVQEVKGHFEAGHQWLTGTDYLQQEQLQPPSVEDQSPITAKLEAATLSVWNRDLVQRAESLMQTDPADEVQPRLDFDEPIIDAVKEYLTCLFKTKDRPVRISSNND